VKITAALATSSVVYEPACHVLHSPEITSQSGRPVTRGGGEALPRKFFTP